MIDHSIGRIARGVGRRVRTVAQGLAAAGPKLWYGNSAGLHANRGARSELRRLRRATTSGQLSACGAIDRERAQRLEADGYLSLPRMVDETTLTTIRAGVVAAFEDPARSVDSPNGATRFLLEPEKTVPGLGALLTDEICRAVAAYYGCGLRVESVRVWRNHHVPGIDGNTDDRFSNTFHHDNCPVSGLRVFVLLNDGVTRETGAFRFHDRQTSERLVRSPGFFHRNMMSKAMRRRLIDPQTLRHFEGDAGDTCICNTQQCLHAASVPRAGSFRDILQFEVYPDAGPLRSGEELTSLAPPDAEVLAMRP